MSNDIGAGIATAGLGLGAGLIGWQDPEWGAFAFLFVGMACFFIWVR